METNDNLAHLVAVAIAGSVGPNFWREYLGLVPDRSIGPVRTPRGNPLNLDPLCANLPDQSPQPIRPLHSVGCAIHWPSRGSCPDQVAHGRRRMPGTR